MSDSTYETNFTSKANFLAVLPFLTLIPVPLISIFNPYSLITTFPLLTLMSADLHKPLTLVLGISLLFLVLFIPRYLFLKLAQQIQRTENLVPRWTLPILITFFLLSCVWAYFGWGNTVSYVSFGRANALVIQSLIPPIIIIGWFTAFRSKLTKQSSIFLHWISIGWILWSAFPWYGELL